MPSASPPAAPASPSARTSRPPRAGTDAARETRAAARRAAWLKTLHLWHWVSSAACLAGMLLFAVTGITLNHAADIPAKPVLDQRTLTLPPALRADLEAAQDTGFEGEAPLPAALRAWLASQLPRAPGNAPAEWSADEIYLALPRPGGDAWLRIARDSGTLEFEDTDRGWIAYLNDLHKGRHTGLAWRVFIDVFSLACLVFSLTGLWILKLRAAGRPGTWPLVGLGVVLPALLALLFIH